VILHGDSLDLILQQSEAPDLIVTDPPYAFGGSGDEHAISATVAVVLREAARRLAKGRWMLVMCASSWRSQSYMVEAVRGIVEPVRVATWTKPAARTKTRTSGWAWASVKVIAFRKGKAADPSPCDLLDHITAPPIANGRRAELPPEVALWMVRPFAVPGGLLLDPFAGSGAIPKAGEACGMRAVGYERNPAQGGEARRAETLAAPSSDEHPVREADAP
jgi:DNA modification methylase